MKATYESVVRFHNINVQDAHSKFRDGSRLVSKLSSGISTPYSALDTAVIYGHGSAPHRTLLTDSTSGDGRVEVPVTCAGVKRALLCNRQPCGARGYGTSPVRTTRRGVLLRFA
ncbi:hypothetical protein J6590_022733 [Homalodisca vitripennis]|nr:hypothetical protein J6590_022733 [Homalodisca vitripennis]